MRKMKVLFFAMVAVFALAATGDAMTKTEKCTLESSGFRSGYSTKKVYTCEVDLKRLWLIDQGGYKKLAPAGVYKVGTGQGAREMRVDGGFIVK